MVAYLSKSDASEGFNQIIDFFGSSIKYALTVNPNIYVSCIKKFWTTVAVKQVNDITRLQSLVDKKKVVVTEATIREAFRLDDEEGVECLPNEKIFVELARMGYEKPSTKLTFFKAFFSSQWKFLIHTILQCMSAKRTSWNEFSSSMASAVICLSSGRKFNFSKYIDSLVRNVDSPTKFYMYPRFLQLMIRKQVDENDEEVNAGDAAKGDVSATHGEVPTVQPTPPQSPQKIEHLEFDKVAQALEITKLKRRVKKLERRNKVRVLKLRRGMLAEMDHDANVVLEDDKEVADEAKEEDKTEPTEVQEVVYVVTTAKIITKVVTAANETITAASTNITAVEARVPGVTLTADPIMPNEDDDVYTEATPLARKVLVVDYQIIELNNKPYYKIIRADDTHQLYVSFLSLLRNFDIEDLEALWSLVKEIFSTTKPKNFSDDFLLVTLEAMFEKPDIHAQIWKTQRNVHGPAKVKGWKLLESFGVQIITFTSTQLILLVERKYPLTRFTLD
uniref:Synaptobrevin, longin-like domain protein n=1 Tax=Tanacetum cinerariifolium TaxID=118510 RepID=A0A6L2N0T5_TANCI|nr:hypothetical protein [Tanacetum cinerariifolium]